MLDMTMPIMRSIMCLHWSQTGDIILLVNHLRLLQEVFTVPLVSRLWGFIGATASRFLGDGCGMQGMNLVPTRCAALPAPQS